MTSEDRRNARYQRRKTARETKRNEKLGAYDDFMRIADVDNLYEAFKKSKRGVIWKESIQRYEANAMRNVAETRRMLLAGENVQSGFVEFTLHERGKVRHIKSVHISERVVQKCLCDFVLNPLLTNSLIHDNGASIKDKGVSFALRRLIVHLGKYYRERRSNEGYALLIDFSKFFDNIRHDILFELLKQYVKDARVLDLTRRFVEVFGDGVSLGLGSQISQISAIFYPNKLDHFIKEVLRIKYYGRYMDDLYLIHADKAYLQQCLAEIKTVCDSLGITINAKKTQIVRLKDGVSFLKGKYVLKPSGKILRLPTKAATTRMRRKLKKFKPLIEAGKMSFMDLRSAYQSWKGNYRKRFNAYYRIRHLDALYNELYIKQEASNVSGNQKRK